MCSSKIFGGSKVSTPEVTKIDPTVSDVTGTEVDSGSGSTEAARKQAKKRGYAATRLAAQAATTLSGGAGKTTLG